MFSDVSRETVPSLVVEGVAVGALVTTVARKATW